LGVQQPVVVPVVAAVVPVRADVEPAAPVVLVEPVVEPVPIVVEAWLDPAVGSFMIRGVPPSVVPVVPLLAVVPFWQPVR